MEPGRSSFNNEPNLFEKSHENNLPVNPNFYEKNRENSFDRTDNSKNEVFGETKKEDSSIKLPAPVANTAVSPVYQAKPSDSKTLSIAANPLYAKDGDAIEKEWIDRAKQIIVETVDDPYLREQRIGDLQRDYIKKRYDREINKPI
jgi:hypothetical protein